MNTAKYIYIVLAVSVAALFSSCDEELWPDAPRLFRPVAVEDVVASGNSLIAKWTPVKGAVDYTVEISRDTFQTIISSISTEGTSHVFTDLEWDVLYQIRVKANSSDTEGSSRFSMIGNKRTEKFPSIMQTITSADVIDKAVQIKWTDKDDPATRVTFEVAGELVKEVMIDADETAAGKMEIFGLLPSTTYKLSIWSGDADTGYKLRGYDTFTTKPAIESDLIVDLRDSISTVFINSDFLATVPNGAVLLLKGAETYNFNGALAGDITIMTGYSFTGRATLRSTGAFNFVAGTNYGKITIKDVNIIGDDTGFAARYVFNINQSGTAQEILIEDCYIYDLRGVLRTQAGPQLQKVTIDNCIIDSINGYGVMNCDNASSSIVEMTVNNSTMLYVQKILVNSKSVTTTQINFNNNTVCWAPLGNNYIFDMNTQIANVKMDNNIFGPAWPTVATPPNVLVRGFRGNLTFGSGANFLTSDFVADEPTALPGTEVINSSASTLWEDPAKRKFKIIDTRFGGKDVAGDPRWRK